MVPSLSRAETDACSFPRGMTGSAFGQTLMLLEGRMVRCYRRRIPAERLAAYRREALFSLAGFAAMEIVKKTSPEFFLTTKLLRSGLVLLLARRFITNGVSGLVRQRRRSLPPSARRRSAASSSRAATTSRRLRRRTTSCSTRRAHSRSACRRYPSRARHRASMKRR